MKIEIQKKDLLSLLSKTLNIVEKRNTMPILVNVLLEASGSSLKAYATDLEVSLTDHSQAVVKEAGKVAVSAKSLFDITKELFEGPLQLIKKENNWLEIKQGKFLSKIVGVAAEEYPVFPTYNSDRFFKIDSAEFKEMIDKTIYSVSNDETRYHLNGVYFESTQKNNITMVATDGHRLSLIKKEFAEINFNEKIGVIIPKKGLFEIKKLIESNVDNVFIAVEGSQFILKSGSCILMIRLIEGKYPNYQQFIPQKLSQKIIIPRDLILSSLKRVSLLANQKSKAILFSFSANKLEITSSNPELGDAKEELDLDYSGPDIKIGFNARYIEDVLKNIEQDKIEIELNDQISPGIIKGHANSDYINVVMPMRI
ncbi:MAG: DNA polymerase III subunit beta [Moraxellaceae bacterium]|nr:DNA polymerase III subunit beta [Pseudobdellovibrionaceae bacterium]